VFYWDQPFFGWLGVLVSYWGKTVCDWFCLIKVFNQPQNRLKQLKKHLRDYAAWLKVAQ